jgi:hypothetical protein
LADRCTGTKRDGAPCGAFALPDREGPPRCYSHSDTISPTEKRLAWQRGGYASTRSDPALVDLAAPALATPTQIREARQELYQMVRSRAVTPQTGSVLGSLLDAADRAVHQRAQRAMERRAGRKRPVVKVVLAFGRGTPEPTVVQAAASVSPVRPVMTLTDGSPA